MHHICLCPRAEIMHHIDTPMKSSSISTSARTSRSKETPTFKPIRTPYFAERDRNLTITLHSTASINVYPHGNALRFIDDPLNCYHNSQVTLLEISYLEDLLQLVLGKSVESNNFRDNLRQ